MFVKCTEPERTCKVIQGLFQLHSSPNIDLDPSTDSRGYNRSQLKAKVWIFCFALPFVHFHPVLIVFLFIVKYHPSLQIWKRQGKWLLHFHRQYLILQFFWDNRVIRVKYGNMSCSRSVVCGLL